MTLCLRNRQRECPLDLRLLRRILRFALERSFSTSDYELCFHFVPAPEMASRCFKRLDAAGIRGEVRIVHAQSDTKPWGTQGPVWYVGGKAV